MYRPGRSKAIQTLKTEEVFGILLQMQKSGFREMIGPPCTVDEEGMGYTSFEFHHSVTLYTSVTVYIYIYTGFPANIPGFIQLNECGPSK